MSFHDSSTDTVLPGQSDTILEIRDLEVTYNMNRGISRVVDGISLDVQRNEIIGVVGESGSGKSMFASSMLDAVPKPGRTTGGITYFPGDERDPIEPLDLSKNELKRFRWEEVSMVFQGAMSSFNPTMKIREHFRETIEIHDKDLEEHMKHAYDLLEELYLDPVRVMDSYAQDLSGGMRQRALIALSLVLKPKVLIMDEPTAALDLLMQRSIMNMIQDLQEEYDITIIFITHDLPLVAGLVDRIAVMYAFEFVEIGPSEDVLLNAAHPYTRALLRAAPGVFTSVDDLAPIEGDSPDPVNVPEGCSYHPRCPLADEICRTNDPGPYEVDSDHHVHCHHWEDSADAITYSLIDEEEESL